MQTILITLACRLVCAPMYAVDSSGVGPHAEFGSSQGGPCIRVQLVGKLCHYECDEFRKEQTCMLFLPHFDESASP